MTLIALRILTFAVALIQAPANSPANNGVVTGRLLAIDGSPAVAVRIMAMAAVEPALVEPVGNAVTYVNLTMTDSTGRYRLENIPPGRYFITAGLTDMPTYYPGSDSMATAKVISVASGTITSGIDFAIQIGLGFKVTGRLAVVPMVKPSPSALVAINDSTNHRGFETTIHDDGTFEFPRVRPGTYKLATSIGLISTAPVVVKDRDVTVVVGSDVKGVRVIGRVVAPSAPGATLPSVTVALAPTTGSGTICGQFLSTVINSDWTFEFPQVPPGVYSVGFGCWGFPSVSSLVVADKDINNLEVDLPITVEVNGRVVVDDGSTLQICIVYATNSKGTIGADCSGGAFSLRLPEGSYQISLRNTARGYKTKSIRSGDIDLTKSALVVERSKSIEQIQIVTGK